MDYFVAYLYGHLCDHRFPEVKDTEFINTRAGEAYNTMTRLILEGRSQPVAEELAMRVLLNGYYVSRWDVIFNLLEELFHNDLPTEEAKSEWADLLLGLRYINAMLDKYEVNGDFLSRDDYQPLQNELAGMISEIIKKTRDVLQETANHARQHRGYTYGV